ncbi:hypothetical protein VC83_00146 [Pseudogymnoascus destructans]|uniref:Uncharacterized protein n=1 Tax=Pseudogymnoascus destructans TaxID=655981 RepID=A0A177ALZ0_9PEZI|nr:uncharacterized protein VC83_00146 [Pseudogymnoascus destructans]OAF63045.2 hypothetical protein VC83_00146 [Pseudogymnoascus destructans]
MILNWQITWEEDLENVSEMTHNNRHQESVIVLKREAQPASERRRRSHTPSLNNVPECDNSNSLDGSSLAPEHTAAQTSEVSLFGDMRPTQEVRVEVRGADLFKFRQQKFGESGTVAIKCPFGGKPLPSVGIAFGSSNILYVKMEFSMELCGAIVEHVRVAEDKVLRGKMR